MEIIVLFLSLIGYMDGIDKPLLHGLEYRSPELETLLRRLMDVWEVCPISIYALWFKTLWKSEKIFHCGARERSELCKASERVSASGASERASGASE